MSQHRHPAPPACVLTWEATLAPHAVTLTVRGGSGGVELIVTGDHLAVRSVLERPPVAGAEPEPSTALAPATTVGREMPSARRPPSGRDAAF